MLKKLVKYGNSNALVFDKALLELLDIEQGATVKIKTDGKSLIITPQHSSAEEFVSKTISPEETFKEAARYQTGLQCNNPAQGQAYLDGLLHVMAQYKEIIKGIDTPVINKSLQELDERFKNDRKNPEYLKAMIELRDMHASGLAPMDKEIQAVSEQYELDEYLDKKSNTSIAVISFLKVHKKYHHVQLQVAKLQENHDFIHESVLIAEKYHATKDFSEYAKEYTDLVSRFIPEYAAYQAELKEVAQALAVSGDNL